MSNHLLDLIASRVPDPEKIFIQSLDGESITYRQMLSASARYANALVSLGVEPGDRVAMQMEKSPAFLFIYLACLRAGAVFLPLNTAYTPHEVGYFLSDAKPKLIVCDIERADSLRDAAGEAEVRIVTHGQGQAGELYDLAAISPPDFANAARGDDDLAAILYTSGTTGRSKGAMLSHDNLASNALTLVDYWRFTPDDVLIHALPVYHTHGLFVATNNILLCGGSMIFLPKFSAPQILEAMSERPDRLRGTVLMGVPTFYTRLLDEPGLTREACSHMRLFISGSAPLLAETHRAFSNRAGHAILERYGMTETNMNTSNPYDGERIAGTVGFPLPGVSLRVADPQTGAALPSGEIGVIEVKGPNVFKGYWLMPEKTASEFRPDGFFITGDLGTIDDRGYVRIVGRGKDLIITGGLNVYPKEIETEIDSLPGVVESAVIGLPDHDFGEAVAAVVVRAKAAPIDEAAIHDALQSRLAKFKWPKKIFFVDDLPRNTMGKVQKNVLRTTYGG
ncbi:malonyl-CoA synthase [Rhodoblastus acidophilus]|uniref:Malonyl-CoA synthase n=1 Tax=Candidatus Rhodoblastus alkanivorans TaxID=2954117 RepID=A0ABS9Z822_9HYPH|nr:malonyl-CoA synthase [Candidatus Rhodoblastus alkanivorans]MCI4677953.1 malonyl-CoA synthase [Candidatus Rhodoblastus alkanivorans]MCI4683848.1 malonyl-CoA synthase [Candidatus Rhodoblastus alkanivorans]MDI4641166.1 malonyl-CoA synthase [Rhodoblastus acidophilus]